MAIRALRSVPRDLETVVPALLAPVFFFVVNVGALEPVAGRTGVTDFRAFQLPVAIVFAVTGISRASGLVTDISSGYFDRLLLTPMRRPALLLGLMVADLALVMALCVPVLLLGLVVSVRFSSGLLGAIVFVVIAGLWGPAFTGFPYAIALRTGSPGAVNSSFLLFFRSPSSPPRSCPSRPSADGSPPSRSNNPVTYLLAALRSLLGSGWVWGDLWPGLLAILGVGVFSFVLAFTALRSRVSRG
ncbi:hypothetical protein ACFVIY_41680 [Streptomyces sp. NPDC127166]|uniref:hypothetical protein n=1 Tax=Streptomyces sp. NPDC127166 TaxID=3345380 RepID=UPI0036347792